jgi:hypothetical protein
MSFGGMSTRTVGAPVGMTSRNGSRQPGSQIVPLSIFFLRMQGMEPESPHKVRSKKDKDKGKNKRKHSRSGAEMAASDQTATVGGGHDQAAAAGEKQSGEPAAEAMTAASGGPSKMGATRATSGAMGSGNVAAYPVPIGVPLRREAPWMGKKKRRRTKEQKRELIGRLLSVVG